MENQNNVNTKPAIKPEISFEDFMKADIRMCKILSVEKVEGADKLYKIVIDTGIDTRVVVSAVAHKLKAEDLLLSTMPFILNLPPRKIKGKSTVNKKLDNIGKYFINLPKIYVFLKF